MKRSVKAALISVLVFPGAGHVYLKRTARGLLFVVPTLVAVMVFLNDAFEQATAIAGEILAGTMAPDPAAMAARLEQHGGSTLATVAAGVMIVCWIGAAVDAWMLGRV